MAKISLVVSDVDGTLVTPDKELTKASERAVRLLNERGIGFTVVSSRPPNGLRMLIEPLSLRLMIGAFSGSTILLPTLEVIESHYVPESAARKSAELLADFSADIWLYTTEGWLVRNTGGHYIAREERTIQAGPILVDDFDPYFTRASKIVGSSQDFAKLAQCEGAVREEIGEQAFVVRSQPYYLDITPPGFDKGTFVETLSQRFAIPLDAIAVLGDMDNDVAMFRTAGMSIAMGNASPEVKSQADHVTTANTEDGFAAAIEQYVLAGAK